MKKKSIYRTALLGFGFLALSTTLCFGQNEPQEVQKDTTEIEAEKIIEKLDADDDLFLNKKESEASVKIALNFEKIDIDKDGLISKTELAEFLSTLKKD